MTDSPLCCTHLFTPIYSKRTSTDDSILLLLNLMKLWACWDKAQGITRICVPRPQSLLSGSRVNCLLLPLSGSCVSASATSMYYYWQGQCTPGSKTPRWKEPVPGKWGLCICNFLLHLNLSETLGAFKSHPDMRPFLSQTLALTSLARLMLSTFFKVPFQHLQSSRQE